MLRDHRVEAGARRETERWISDEILPVVVEVLADDHHAIALHQGGYQHAEFTFLRLRPPAPAIDVHHRITNGVMRRPREADARDSAPARFHVAAYVAGPFGSRIRACQLVQDTLSNSESRIVQKAIGRFLPQLRAIQLPHN